MEKWIKHTESYTLTTNFYDEHNHLSMTGVLDLFQNAAVRHAILLGAGTSSINALGYFWMIAKNEVHYLKHPGLISSVKVVTWPLSPSRFFFDRHYQVTNDAGDEVIIEGRSRWVLVSMRDRKMVGSNNYHYPLPSFSAGLPRFKEAFPLINEGEEVVGTYVVRPSDLDENHHLNNSRYGNIIFDFLTQSANEVINDFSIQYLNEAAVGDTLVIYRSINGPRILISGRKNDIIVFKSEVSLAYVNK